MNEQQYEVPVQKQEVVAVRVMDFDMPIWSWVTLMLKVAIASIPAMIILWGFAFAMGIILTMVFGIGGAVLGG